LDSCAGGVFRKKTPAEAKELMAKISQNYDDWTMAESTPANTNTNTSTNASSDTKEERDD
jgi:hypothetical protein